ncbi:MAG: lamin tail domain-containing protein [Xanthomonadaceae bacterium]|nr:lamin tail domain-containing protein [Xanthomonadaceae bacterium]
MICTQRLRALAIVALSFFAASAQADVVVSQVYGGGGNSGATLRNDFIELFNNGSDPVDLNGWTVQYASAAGTSWTRTNLSGSIAPGGYFLVQQAAGTGGSVSLPTPDSTGTIAMSGTAGKVALVNSTTALVGTCPSADATLIDLVGYGSTASCALGSPTGNLSNTNGALRKEDGCTNTRNNNADFSITAPTPRNAAAPTKDCGAPPPPPPPVVVIPIHDLQGPGNTSPFVDQAVAVEGIVTLRKFNGFFVQAAANEEDADPLTSEAVFVFTTSAGAPAEAQVGNRVQVRGTVAEFVPSSDVNQLPVTELTFATTTVIDTGNPLPEPILIDATVLNANTAVDFLERYEGMRVSVPELLVTGPGQGNINESQATSTSNGVFLGVPAGVARPFREPGISVLDVAPIPPTLMPPLYDANPEILRVDSRGTGVTLISVDAGATVSGLVGVLDYGTARYTVLPDPGVEASVVDTATPTAVSVPGAGEITVGSFNILRFFDDNRANNTGSSPTLTAAAFQARLRKTSNAVCQFLHTPDILGVVEVEGIDALTALANAINDNLPGTCERNPHYVAYLAEGNDIGGIDVGFLVTSAEVATGLPRVRVNDVVQEGKDTVIANPNGSTSILNDRPPLRLSATVSAANGAQYDLTVIANHLRSLSDVNSAAPGSNGWATDGDRVRDKRARQALFLANLVQTRQSANPDERILLLGDFNAYEFSDGLADVMGIITGQEAAANEVRTWLDSPVFPPLLNMTNTSPANDRYSFVFDGSAQTLDHIVVNQALLSSANAVRIEHARLNADFGNDNFGDPNVPVRVSDHDPVLAYLAVPTARNADLRIGLSGPRLPVTFAGDVAVFEANIANQGPNPALNPHLQLRFDGRIGRLDSIGGDGWSCDAPVAIGTSPLVSVDCHQIGFMASGESQTLALNFATLTDLRVGLLAVLADVDSATNDPAPNNNHALNAVLVVRRGR